MFQNNLFRKNLLATSILVAAGSLYGGYGNKALAGSCTFGAPTATDLTVTCSGAASPTGNDTPQFFEFTGNITITDDDSFGFDNTSTVTSDNAIETFRGSANINLDGDIRSYDTAIRARVSEDNATIQITTSGLITSLNDKGIDANTDENSGDVTIMSSGTIVSEDEGIYVEQEGQDANVTITNSGMITSDNSAGIEVSAEDITGNVTITNLSGAQIAAEDEGIVANVEGRGALTTITNSGSIISNEDYGIYVEADQDTGNVTISHNVGGTIRSKKDGIKVYNSSNTTTQITSSGTIISEEESGIQFVSGNYSSETVNIDVNNNITASNGSGVELINDTYSGITTSTINVDNNATIDAQKGIDIQVRENSQVAVNIKSGTTVKGSINAIEDTGGGSGYSAETTVTLEGALEGNVALGDDDDVFIMKGPGASLAAGNSVNGGADTDEFYFDNVQIASDSFFSNAINNFELIELKNASTIRLNNQTWTANTININSGNTLEALGTTTLNGNLNHHGIISLRNGVADEVLNITGNLSGSGTFELDSDLEVEDDTDYINVGGDVTGLHTLVITNLYDLGYDTGTDDTDGIQVVDVGGTATAASFALAGGPVNSGAYVYDLHMSAGNDFYLQSMEGMMSSSAALVPSLARGSTLGADALLLGYLIRKGSRLEAPINLEPQDDTRDDDGDGSSFGADILHASEVDPANTYWLRLLGAHGEYEGRVDVAGMSQVTETDSDFGGVQLGIDFAMPYYPHTYASLWGHYLYQENDVYNKTQAADAGSSTIRSYGAGLGIIYDPGTGLYFDALGSVSFSSADLKDAAGISGDTRGNEYFASAELGYRMDSGFGNLVFIPQAQIKTHYADFASYTDSSGLRVSNLDSHRSTLRLGMSVEDTYQMSNGNLRLVGGVSWSDVFSSETRADLAAVQVDLSDADQFIEGNLGFQFSMDNGSSIWGSVNHKSGLDSLDSENTSFDLGFSVKF